MRLCRKRINRVENAVKPEADQGLRRFRLDMDVACLLLDRVFQHIVDSIDDVLVVHIFCLTQTGEIFQIVVIFFGMIVCRCFYRLFEAEKIVDSLVDFLRRSDNRNYFTSARCRKLVDEIHSERVCHRNDKSVALFVKRDEPV